MHEELKSGARTLDEADLPEAAAILFRYQRAAEEGAAKLNLRMLAAVFAGQAMHRSVAADDFLYLADILAPLKREEVILLGTMVRLHAKQTEQIKSIRNLQVQALDELVPNVFANAEDFMATAGALLRTGLLMARIPPADYEGQGSGFIYRPTRLLLRLNQLSNIEGVVERCVADDSTSRADGLTDKLTPERSLLNPRSGEEVSMSFDSFLKTISSGRTKVEILQVFQALVGSRLTR